jgi:hypothetical protein
VGGFKWEKLRGRGTRDGERTRGKERECKSEQNVNTPTRKG